ncbi:MAG: V-type ATP synthase subunit D [Euryarchaeota archaeon]|nr:V-type ATP synthase subunit D [Euryarchaeota archaeon]
MAELIEGVNPTRMELLKLKTKLTLAVKGHRLLKQKRDALIMEFFNILEEVKEKRKKTEEELAKAFKSLILAEATLGAIKVSDAAMAVAATNGLDVESRNIMGVKVPVLNLGETKRSLLERGYGLVDTSSQLDDAAGKFEEALKTVAQLAETEKSVRLLAEEIESTKRRVNALESTLIPRLSSTVRYIRLRLDEMERENFFKLKRIKAIMEAAEA